MEAGSIDVVLFDLGGVLIEFGGVTAMRELTGIRSDEELWRRWLGCPWVRDFERGRCSPNDFASGVIRDWGLSVNTETFLDAFRSWPRGPIPGAVELLQSVRRTIPVGCLSNTNTLHWNDHARHWTIFDAFEFRFLSFEMGLIKPDREMFDRVSELLRAPPERMLFLDDNALNVNGAVAAGFHAIRVTGVDEARGALVDSGILTGSR
jgi:HAD superfamily hydrolase (TIGR01509 family)